MLLNLVFGKNKTVTAELPPKEAEMLVIAAAMYIEDTYADDFDDEDCGYCEEDEEDEEPVKTAPAALRVRGQGDRDMGVRRDHHRAAPAETF